MRENGLKIKLMVTVFTLISMAVDTRVSGFKTNNTDSVLSNGLMAQNMRVSTSKEWNMAKENSFGLTRVHTMEIFSKTISMVRVNTSGQMEEFTMGNGLTIKWRG
jgi:hypothetical protein